MGHKFSYFESCHNILPHKSPLLFLHSHFGIYHKPQYLWEPKKQTSKRGELARELLVHCRSRRTSSYMSTQSTIATVVLLCSSSVEKFQHISCVKRIIRSQQKRKDEIIITKMNWQVGSFFHSYEKINYNNSTPWKCKMHQYPFE